MSRIERFLVRVDSVVLDGFCAGYKRLSFRVAGNMYPQVNGSRALEDAGRSIEAAHDDSDPSAVDLLVS